MREFIYKIFVEDLFLKSISLVVALTLVFVVRTELEANTTLFVKVTYTEPRDRLMVSQPRVDQVKVVVRGPWGRINRAGETPLEPIHLDLSSLREGDLRFTPEAQRTYRRQAGAVLVAQRQMKQEVADACDAQLGQVLGDFLADAIQARDGLIQRDGAGHRARFPLRR